MSPVRPRSPALANQQSPYELVRPLRVPPRRATVGAGSGAGVRTALASSSPVSDGAVDICRRSMSARSVRAGPSVHLQRLVAFPAAPREFGRLGLAPCPLGVDAMDGVYVPRSPTTGVLYGVVRAHFTDFLATAAAPYRGCWAAGVGRERVPEVPAVRRAGPRLRPSALSAHSSDRCPSADLVGLPLAQVDATLSEGGNEPGSVRSAPATAYW